MYSKIIVPLDGSPFAERVLPHVEALAAKFGSVLVLVSIVPVRAMLAGQSLVAASMVPVDSQYVDVAGSMDAEEQRARDYLDITATRLRSKGLRVECAWAEGRPAEEVVGQAIYRHADLIAMTTHGRGGLSRLFMGSVADEVLHLSPCPVLLVRNVEAPVFEDSDKGI